MLLNVGHIFQVLDGVTINPAACSTLVRKGVR
jgi:hypothetical protein